MVKTLEKELKESEELLDIAIKASKCLQSTEFKALLVFINRFNNTHLETLETSTSIEDRALASDELYKLALVRQTLENKPNIDEFREDVSSIRERLDSSR